jgi:hypothetical protein
MDDFVLMQVLQGRNNLCQIVLGLHFRESLSPFDQLVKSMIGADLKQNVDVLLVFEHTFKFDNVVIV